MAITQLSSYCWGRWREHVFFFIVWMGSRWKRDLFDFFLVLYQRRKAITFTETNSFLFTSFIDRRGMYITRCKTTTAHLTQREMSIKMCFLIYCPKDPVGSSRPRSLFGRSLAAAAKNLNIMKLAATVRWKMSKRNPKAILSEYRYSPIKKK